MDQIGKSKLEPMVTLIYRHLDLTLWKKSEFRREQSSQPGRFALNYNCYFVSITKVVREVDRTDWVMLSEGRVRSKLVAAAAGWETLKRETHGMILEI